MMVAAWVSHCLRSGARFNYRRSKLDYVFGDDDSCSGNQRNAGRLADKFRPQARADYRLTLLARLGLAGIAAIVYSSFFFLALTGIGYGFTPPSLYASCPICCQSRDSRQSGFGILRHRRSCRRGMVSRARRPSAARGIQHRGRNCRGGYAAATFLDSK